MSILRSDGAQRALSLAWFTALVITALVLFVPVSDAESTRRFGAMAGYPADVVENTYRLIRVAMPLLPAGMLLRLVLPVPAIRLLALVSVFAGAGLAFAATTGTTGIALVRDLLSMIPGLAAGMWIAERSRPAASVAAQSAGTVFGAKTIGAAAISNLAPAAGLADTLINRSFDRGTADPKAAAGWLRRLLGLALVGIVIALASDVPRWGLLIAVGLALYATMLWWRPLTSLLLVPATLPLLDLAPWTGRFFWDEFDLLMLTTLAMGLWHGQFKAVAWRDPKLRLLLAVFVALTVVSLLLGLFPLQAWDANALSAYWSHYNSLRLGKGLLWGLVFYGLYRSWPDQDRAFAMLCGGMALGVLGVSGWALWEQLQFAGAATTADYRVTGSFSSMHTGGGHFEAYLAMALPFVWGLLFRLRPLYLRALLAAIFLFGSYALLTTVARGGALALALALLLLVGGTWQARRRHATTRARFALPLLLGLSTLAVMAMGVSSVFWTQRMAQTGADADIRLRHWSEVLDLRDAAWTTTLFGQGLGSLPASNLVHKLPDEAGSYRYGVDGGITYLALNSTESLYMAQRVAVRPAQTLTLQIDTRVPAGKGGLEASLCEKNLFNSRHCEWLKVDVKPDKPGWQSFSQTFSTGELAAGSGLTQRPVQFSLYNPVPGTVIEVTHARLLDADGHNLLKNGDFAQGGDFWFFKSGDHLFWHAKNLWVHLLFEQGWLGLLAFGLITVLALVRLTRSVRRGALESTVWLAAFAAMATVGMVDSLVDAPRLAQLAYLVLFAGATSGAPTGVHAGRPRSGAVPTA